MKTPTVKSINPNKIRKDLKERKEYQALELIDAHVRSYDSLWDLFVVAKKKVKSQSVEIEALKEKLKVAEEILEFIYEECDWEEFSGGDRRIGEVIKKTLSKLKQTSP